MKFFNINPYNYKKPYFSRFRKDSPARKLYGRGFVYHRYPFWTYTFGIKFRKTGLKILRLHTKNQKLWMFRLVFCVITIGYRNIMKTYLDKVQKIWRSKKSLLSLRRKEK